MIDAGLVVCATPIGNLGDTSDRLRSALGAADIIYCEDTRRTRKLLSHLGLSTPTRSLFVGNERSRTEELLRDLADGRVVALVSDAGMPTVSDPGSLAIQSARAEGYPIHVVPGPSAVTAALALAGYGADRFVFEGFLPRKGAERVVRLAAIARDPRVTVVFASPNRIAADLADLAADQADRPVTILRELTKLHEDSWSGPLAGAAEHFAGTEVKGEITVVLGPGSEERVDTGEAVEMARRLVADGETISRAARTVAELTGASRRDVYNELIGQG